MVVRNVAEKLIVYQGELCSMFFFKEDVNIFRLENLKLKTSDIIGYIVKIRPETVKGDCSTEKSTDLKKPCKKPEGKECFLVNF